MKLKKKRLRLSAKHRLRMPKPGLDKKDKGFTLRCINEADSRFAVVKKMKKRLEELLEDCKIESTAEEWLAARAVFIVGYLESMEIDAYEGKEISWSAYIQACNGLNGLLTKLGAFSAERNDDNFNLDTYLNEKRRKQS